MTQAPVDFAKRAAAEAALELVRDGMRLGLGSGSTAAWFVKLLGERVAQGLNVTCVATSSGTARLAAEAGVPLVRLAEAAPLDLTVDGADELDADLRLIKGGGAALLQEKIVAAASKRLVIVADSGKRVQTFGAFPLPVEVVKFGWPVTQAAIERALADAAVDSRGVALRVQDGDPIVTDEGHYILDLRLGRIGAPRPSPRRSAPSPAWSSTGSSSAWPRAPSSAIPTAAWSTCCPSPRSPTSTTSRKSSAASTPDP